MERERLLTMHDEGPRPARGGGGDRAPTITYRKSEAQIKESALTRIEKLKAEIVVANKTMDDLCEKYGITEDDLALASYNLDNLRSSYAVKAGGGAQVDLRRLGNSPQAVELQKQIDAINQDFGTLKGAIQLARANKATIEFLDTVVRNIEISAATPRTFDLTFDELQVFGF